MTAQQQTDAARAHAASLALQARFKRDNAAFSGLLEAASTYANRYAQDEADDDGPYLTGCSEQQHKDAVALFDAINYAKGSKP